MTKRIILTTMSIFSGGQKNFYVTEDDKYCEGISQLEAGTKYYLSTVENIKEIIVIGSDQVIDLNKDNKNKSRLKNLFKERNILKEYVDEEKTSAYSLYCYGIQCFVNGQEEPSPIQLSENHIDQIRQKQLDKIIEKNTNGSFDERMSNIKKDLKADIKKSYLSEEQKEAYRLGEIPEYDIESKDVQPYINTVKSERSISLFGKEIIFIRLFNEIQNKVLDMSSKQDVVSLEVVKRYQEDLQKLTIELEDIRTNRLNTELQFVKEKIYSEIDNDSKLECRKENKNVFIRFVSLKEKGIDNIHGMLKAIKSNDEDVEIYMDMQGGYRTDVYIRNAVLSLLNNDETSNVQLKKVIAVNFNRNQFMNPIVDETARYKITDLVSGMNAFINYGKAEQLNQTWSELNKNKKSDSVQSIIRLMQAVDHSLSLCDVNALVDNISKLYVKLSKKIKVTNSNEEFMEVLRNNILEDYKGIVDEKKKEIDILELVRWAYNKGFIQQAITLIESRMPGQMVKDGYFTYCSTASERKEAYRVVKEAMKSGDMQKYKLYDMNHAMVQEASYTYKSNYENPQNKIFLRSSCLKTYDNNDEVLIAYAKIWSKRNNTNHAGEKSIDYEQIRKMIDDFIKSYQRIRNLIQEKGNKLKCKPLPKQDINDLMKISKDRNFKRERHYIDEKKSIEESNLVSKVETKDSNRKMEVPLMEKDVKSYKYDYCLFIHDHKTPYTGQITKSKKGYRKEVYPAIKGLYNKFMEGVNDLLNLEDKSKNCEHVFLDSDNHYLNEIKQKSKEAKEKDLHSVFVVAKDIYDKNSQLFTKEIESRQHDLYIIDTKSSPMKIIK